MSSAYLDQDGNEVQGIGAALVAGEEIGELKARGSVHTAVPGGLPFTLVPQGYELKTLEEHLPAPLRTRAVIRTDDAPSFVAYVNRYKDGTTVVFADLAGRKFEAVIDYHYVYGPRWGSHRVTLASAVTPDWDAWTKHSGQQKSQVDFARWIEDHLPNIADPAGAELLLIATTLEAKKDVQFKSSTRLQNGEHQFRYEETITGTAGSQSGSIQIPNEFVLGLEPFQGVGLKRVDARFRYRINQGELKLWFELVRAQDVLEAAFAEVVAQIRAGLGETPGLGETLVIAGAAPVVGTK